MPNSKPLPSFTFAVLYYLNRDQVERFSFVCRALKNFIERYFHSKPYRIFDRLWICGGSYALRHRNVQWHPNRVDYSVQQFLADQKCSIDELKPTWYAKYYSFAEMNPYLGPTVSVKKLNIYVAGGSTYNSEHIAEMESIAYLWRDGDIKILSASDDGKQFGANVFELILNSPTILQCQILEMKNANVSFKDYKVLYCVKVIEIWTSNGVVNSNSLLEFLEQPGIKPLVVLGGARKEHITNILSQLCKAFSSAVSSNAFKFIFVHYRFSEPLTEFRETNNISGEILELKKGLPMEYEGDLDEKNTYTLERSSI